MDEYESLSHTKWECKYHVVFIPKYRREGAVRAACARTWGRCFGRWLQQKESRIEEGHLMPDHVHMMIAIPPKYAVSQVIGYIKGKSAIHMARTYGERRRNFVGQHFWARGYFVSTVGRDEAVIREIHPAPGRGGQAPGSAAALAIGRPPSGGSKRAGRVSGPSQAALSGSHIKAPGSAGGYLQCVSEGLGIRRSTLRDSGLP